MKIKRYSATSMRAALAQVRADQGPDAVILSSCRGEDGIEVIAAIDYDEALFAEAKRQRAPNAPAAAAPPPAAVPRSTATVPPPAPARSTSSVKAATPAPSPAPVRPAAPPRRAAPPPSVAPPRSLAPARNAAPLRPATPPRAATPKRQHTPLPTATRPVQRALPVLDTPLTSARADAGYISMQRELKDMRKLLEDGLASMSWNEKRLREPLRAQVLEDLSAIDIAPDVALALAQLAPRRTTLENAAHIPPALLVRHMPVVDGLSNVNGGVFAVVGPTGAGKTTTIAKLAAHWCMRHGSEDLALVSTDSYRIGARDQLATYSRILDAPMYAVDTGQELGRVLSRLKSKKLVLIDTAGMGPRDLRLSDQLAALERGAAGARVLLALPAQGEAQALDEIVGAFGRLNPAACVLTKVDEAASLGPVISTALRYRLKIAYVCDGQRVPEDLHAAHRRKVWLVRTALKLKERRAPTRDEAYLARNFGRAPAHA
jgi:flagellar biosynthesis protein FlhF